LTKPGQVLASKGAVTLEAKKKRTEEDSVSCPMKYSTDVECSSDSLAVISYRDINQFTYVNLSYEDYTSDSIV
jgi:hypothetical protein